MPFRLKKDLPAPMKIQQLGGDDSVEQNATGISCYNDRAPRVVKRYRWTGSITSRRMFSLS